VPQLALALAGVTVFCVYSRSWQDFAHTVYDTAASLAVFSFIAQLVLEPPRWADGYWRARFLLLAAMTTVTTGREFLHWPVSGHLSCALAVALVQGWNRRLPRWERWCYWLPIPLLLAMRWWLFDQGLHAQTGWAVLFAVASASFVIATGRTKR
jgi:hypothetical protein